jgi:hypothetical protein
MINEEQIKNDKLNKLLNDQLKEGGEEPLKYG